MVLKSAALRKWRRKKWVEIIAPKYFGELPIGVTPVNQPKQAIGRIVQIALSDLTKDSRHKNIEVFFKIEDLKDGKGITRFWGHELSKGYVKRIVRRRKSRVDVIIDVKTQDGKRIRVKSLLITAKKTSTNQRKELRKVSAQVIENFDAKNGFGEFVYKMLVSRLAKKIREKSHLIYPLSNVEIRKSEVL